MPRPITPQLIARMRCADPTARQMVEAHVLENNTDGTPREHVRFTKTHWAEADGGAAGVDADFIRKENGDLTLKGTLRTLLTYSPGAVTYFTDLDNLTPWDVPMVEFPDAESPELELDRIKLYLNPLRVTTQKREVVKWRLELMRPSALLGIAPTGTLMVLQPFADVIDVPITSDAAGFVTFDYAAQGLARPRPLWPPPESFVLTVGDLTVILSDFRKRHVYLFVRALKEDGSPGAGNVGLGYDAGTAEFAAGGYKLRSRRFTKDNSLAVRNLLGSWAYRDGGSAGGAPYCILEAGTYTAKTITFSSNPFNTGGTPTNDLELIGHIQTPEGTSVTLKVRNDADSAYVSFTDGQLHSDVGIGKTQPRKMEATLTPNAAGTLAPTLKRLGLRAVQRLDGSRVCEVRSFEEAFEPEDLHTENALYAKLVGIKDGEQDFQSWIEDLLAQNYPKNILLRSWIMDVALPRHQWLHKTDMLIGNWIGKGAEIELQGLSPLVKLKDMVPPYIPGTNYAPDGVVSDGGWTDLAGGSSNLDDNVDEASADNSDAVRSPTSPNNAEIKFALPTPSDLAGRRLFVDTDYNKDATGGEVIDIRIRFYSNTTLVAELLKADIGVNRVQTTMELTDAQIALFTDLPNARVGFLAHTPSGAGARRAILNWIRFRSGGRREAVTYVGQTLKAVCEDLVDNRLALEKRYRGPMIENTTYTVSKQLTGVRKRTPTGKEIVGKNELEALAFLAGGIIHEIGGRLQFTSVFDAKPIAFVFPSSRIRLPEAGPGLDRRRPEVFINYRWDPTKEEFKDEGHYFHQPSLDAYGRDTLGPPKTLDEEVSKYIDTDVLVDAIGLRHVSTFGCGEMLWPFYSVDPFPEAHIGDLAVVQTDKFCSRDPNVARELRGRMWAVGILQRVDFWGRNFTIWIRNPSDIVATVQAASRIFDPSLQNAQLVWRGDHLFALWVGDAKVRSVKVATSTVSQPAAGTGTTAEGNSGELDTGPFTYTSLVYLTITPYSGAGATGLQGQAYLTTFRLPHIETLIDPTTGKVKRSTAFNDQGSFLAFVSPSPGTFFSWAAGGPASGQMWISFDWSSASLYRPDGTTATVPAPPAAPSAPTLSQVAGGALGARTRFAKVAYVKTDPFTGHETLYPVSAESSFAISANNLLKVTALADPGNGLYSGWVVLVGSTTGVNYVQGVTAKQTFGVDWTEPAGGFSTTQNSLWTSGWKKLTKIGIDPSTTYKHYPYWDIALNFVYIPAETTNPHPQLASLQNGDGVMSLGQYGTTQGFSGVVDIATPAAATTSSGTRGGGRLT